MKKTTKFLVRSAVIAALYAALTFVVAPIAYTPIQFRVSEALTILPLFFPEAIPGLTIGCFIANIPSGPWDMFIGAGATLIAAVLTRLSRKIFPGVVPPILANAFLVPVIFLTNPEFTDPYWLNVLTVGAGELLSVAALGVPLYFVLKRLAAKHPAFFDLPAVKKTEPATGNGADKEKSPETDDPEEISVKTDEITEEKKE